MGRNVGIEPTHNGTTIRRVNHFTNCAIATCIISKKYNKCNRRNKKNKQKKIGNLLSSLTLFSPLKCLTSLFGMGRGVSTLLSSPIKCIIP